MPSLHAPTPYYTPSPLSARPHPHAPSPRALTPIPLPTHPQVSVDSGLVPGAEVTYYFGSLGKAVYKFWLLIAYLASHGE